jgi:hypothetical protein
MDFLQTLLQNKYLFIAHIREIYYRWFDLPSFIPLITTK